jgi:hypothetical protein
MSSLISNGLEPAIIAGTRRKTSVGAARGIGRRKPGIDNEDMGIYN